MPTTNPDFGSFNCKKEDLKRLVQLTHNTKRYKGN
jgi:hypothetical protein